MLVVDSSVIIAILQEKDAGGELDAILKRETGLVMSAGTLVECSLVVERMFGVDAVKVLHDLIEAWKIMILPVTYEQAMIACYAPAKFPSLGYANSFTYALAKDKASVVLHRDSAFTETDLLLFED